MNNYRYQTLLFLAAVLAVSALFCLPPASAGEDKIPPTIELQGLTGRPVIYTDKMYIAGQIIDENAVASLTLNGSPLQYTPGRSIIFSHIAELSEGTNRITIEAVDKAGNRTSKKIVIIREDPDISHLPDEIAARRLRMALYPFEKNGLITGESAMLLDLLTLAVQSQDRFHLVDRNYIESILKEQKLNLTELIDRDVAVRLGKLMSAQAVVTGSIEESSHGMEIVARGIDTETSEILITEKVYSPLKGPSAMNFLADALSVQLHNDFPMIGGIVLKQKDGLIYTDLGEGKVPPHGRFIIYRPMVSEAASGAKVKILGSARVREVLKDMSKAELIEGNIDEIRALDRAIVQ